MLRTCAYIIPGCAILGPLLHVLHADQVHRAIRVASLKLCSTCQLLMWSGCWTSSVSCDTACRCYQNQNATLPQQIQWRLQCSCLYSPEIWCPRLLQGTGAANAAKDIDGCYGMDSVRTGYKKYWLEVIFRFLQTHNFCKVSKITEPQGWKFLAVDKWVKPNHNLKLLCGTQRKEFCTNMQL